MPKQDRLLELLNSNQQLITNNEMLKSDNVQLLKDMRGISESSIHTHQLYKDSVNRIDTIKHTVYTLMHIHDNDDVYDALSRLLVQINDKEFYDA